MKAKLRVVSLGAGVQSSVMALMAAQGELINKDGESLPLPDAAIFADTGWEPSNVYKHLDWLENQLPFKVYKTKVRYRRKRPRDAQGRFLKANIQEHIMHGTNSSGHSFVTIPVYIFNQDGEKAIARRQCTREYKIEPIRQQIRKMIGLSKRQCVPKNSFVEQWIGLSYDELFRMKGSRDKWCVNCWPLIDMKMERKDCVEWFKEHYPGYNLPRSACIGCPLHTDAEWLDMKENDPESWKQAVEIDRSLRKTKRKDKFGGHLYLHRSRTPLEEVDFICTKNDEQPSLKDECEGMCGL